MSYSGIFKIEFRLRRCWGVCLCVCVGVCVCVCGGGGGGGDGEGNAYELCKVHCCQFSFFCVFFFPKAIFLFEVTSAGVKCHVIVENDSPYFTIVP